GGRRRVAAAGTATRAAAELGDQGEAGRAAAAQAAAEAGRDRTGEAAIIIQTPLPLGGHHGCAIEECFGWLKTVAGLGRSRVAGRWKLRPLLQLGAAAFNLVRMRKLAPAA